MGMSRNEPRAKAAVLEKVYHCLILQTQPESGLDSNALVYKANISTYQILGSRD